MGQSRLWGWVHCAVETDEENEDYDGENYAGPGDRDDDGDGGDAYMGIWLGQARRVQ